VDIRVELQDADRHELGIGLGYATDTGLRARLRWELPRINDRGHSLFNRATISQPRQELISTYRIPLKEPLYQSFNFSVGWERTQVETTVSQVTRLDARVLDQWWDGWLSAYGLGFLRETSREGEEVSVLTSYLLPSVTLNFTERDLQPDPVNGYSIWLSFSASGEVLGAQTEFVRAQGGHKRLIDLGGPHLLITRFELGAIMADDIMDVPLSQRFFTGGDQTVRGYELGSLSPRNDEGDLIGGRYLNVASAEYSVKVFPSWRVGFFTDAGRAYNVASEPWHYGVGVGMRWLSPIGQVRVDVAFPVHDEFESGARLHIFMGPVL
jgi:translocation and assembly module TamA